jgi:hypothetical protein
MAVPGNVALRVMNGESMVVCEACLQGSIGEDGDDFTPELRALFDKKPPVR